MRMRMRLKLLLLVAGAVAAPQLAPAPLGLVSGAARISCFAPRRFAGSTFELFVAGRTGPVQSIAAEPGQNKVDFILDEAPAGSRCYRCRYRSYNGSAWQASELSAEIAVNASEDAACLPDFTPAPPPAPTSAARLGARPWLLPVVLSAAVLVLLAAAAAVAWRGTRSRAGPRRGTPRQSSATRTASSEPL